MRNYKKIILVGILLISSKVFAQFDFNALRGGDPNAVYTRVGELAEATAKKFDAAGCPASAAYCRRIVAWSNCMLNHLAGQDCGPQPSLGDAPRCDAASMDGTNSATSASSSNPYKQMQLRQQQTQQELTNAQNASMNAYQQAINNGKKESGATLDATLEGAQQISDPTTSLVYTGIGLGVSLFEHLAEKKAEKKEKELATQTETRKIQLQAEQNALIINTKIEYIKEALKINQYNYTDLILKSRYATLLLIPKDFDAYSQKIYFTYPIEIPKYSDSTYPLKDYVQNKLLEALDKNMVKYESVYTLYPITDVEKFSNQFVKKMGSGTVINLEAHLLKFLMVPFEENTKQNADRDFWGNPLKKENKKIEAKPIKKEDSFWNN